MKEDLNPELYKFLIYKLGLDSLRNSASKLDLFPWVISTKSCCYSNKPGKKCKPSLQKLVQSKSCGAISRPENITLPSSPRHVYFNRQDALKKSYRFAASTAPLLLAISSNGSMLHVGYTTVKISSGFDFPFSDDDDIGEQKDFVSHQLGSEYSFKDQFNGCFKNNEAGFPGQDFPASKDIMQLPDIDFLWDENSILNPPSNELRRLLAVITNDFKLHRFFNFQVKKMVVQNCPRSTDTQL